MAEREVNIPAVRSIALVLSEDLMNIAPFLRWAEFPVKAKGDAELAVGAMSEIKKRVEDIESEENRRWGDHKRVLKDFLGMIVAYEKRIAEEKIKPIRMISDTLKSRVEKFWSDREARLQAEAQAAHDRKVADEKAALARAKNLAATTGHDDAIKEMVQREKNVGKLEGTEVTVNQTIRTTAGTLAQTKLWRWKVVDEAQVPDSFWILDEKALNKIARKFGHSPETIPGIEFYQEVKSSLRA